MLKFLMTSAMFATVAATGAEARNLHNPAQHFEVLGAMSGSDPSGAETYGDQQALLAALPSSKKVRLEKQVVDFTRPMEPGSILVDTRRRKLYLVTSGEKAIMYPIGVGREGFTWSGTDRISKKSAWPDWRPPNAMIRREAERGHFVPAFMPGGPQNPLGARALYIGSTEFRIHGTTQPWSIGRAVSSGCIRMLNEHVIELFDQVRVGAQVVVE